MLRANRDPTQAKVGSLCKRGNISGFSQKAAKRPRTAQKIDVFCCGYDSSAATPQATAGPGLSNISCPHKAGVTLKPQACSTLAHCVAACRYRPTDGVGCVKGSALKQ